MTIGLERQRERAGRQGSLLKEIVPSADVESKGEDPHAKSSGGRPWRAGVLHVLESANAEGQEFRQNRLLRPQAQYLTLDPRHQCLVRRDVDISRQRQ